MNRYEEPEEVIEYDQEYWEIVEAYSNLSSEE